MEQTKKKPYVKPEFTVIPAGSPKYNELMDKLAAEESLSQSPTAAEEVPEDTAEKTNSQEDCHV